MSTFNKNIRISCYCLRQVLCFFLPSDSGVDDMIVRVTPIVHRTMDKMKKVEFPSLAQGNSGESDEGSMDTGAVVGASSSVAVTFSIPLRT